MHRFWFKEPQDSGERVTKLKVCIIFCIGVDAAPPTWIANIKRSIEIPYFTFLFFVKENTISFNLIQI